MNPSSRCFGTCLQIAVILTLGLWSSDLCGQPANHTQRIYNHISHEVAQRNPVRIRNVPVLATGSCWIFSLNGERVFLTAAHNLGLPPNYNPEKIGGLAFGPNYRLRSLTNNVVIGLLAYEPKEIGFVKDAGLVFEDLDLALIRPQQQEVFSSSRVITLAKQPPQQGDRVTVHGFPGQAIEKDLNAVVKVAAPGRNFIVLENLDKDSRGEGGVKPGLSGGVVLNSAREAVALVVTTDVNHFNALLVSEGMFKTVDWKPFSEVQTRKF